MPSWNELLLFFSSPAPKFADPIFLFITAPQKESQFFARIKKNRVDPSGASSGNPGTTYLPSSIDGEN